MNYITENKKKLNNAINNYVKSIKFSADSMFKSSGILLTNNGFSYSTEKLSLLKNQIIKNELYKDKLFEENIESMLNTYISEKITENNKKSEKYLKKYINDFLNRPLNKYNCILPVQFMVIRQNIKIGNLTFFPNSSINNEKNKYFKINDKTNKKNKEFIDKSINNIPLDLPFTEITVIAQDYIAARNIAVKALKLVTDALQVAFNNPEKPYSLNENYFTPKSYIPILVMSEDLDNGQKSFNMYLKHLHQETINMALKDKYISKYLDVIGSINNKYINNKKLTLFEQDLWTASENIADGIYQMNYKNKFIKLMSGIETLVEIKGKGITKKISENVAFIIGNLENPYAITNIEKDIRYLYGLRSEISHGSNPTISLNDVKQLSLYAVQLILIMAYDFNKYNKTKTLKKEILTKEVNIIKIKYNKTINTNS